MTEGSGSSRERHYVRAVERTILVIRAFGAERSTMTLSEVAEASGLDRATARRILLTLADLGYVRRSGRQFELTPLVLQLGYAYLSGMSLVEIVRPHLRRLAERLGETASLTVLDGDEVVYLDLASGSRLSSVRINVGTRFKAHATSMGRVLLGGLPQEELEQYLEHVTADRRTERTVRPIEDLRAEIKLAVERGWATVDQELEEGLRGVAAPIHDRQGAVIAALNVSAHANRKTIAELAELYVPAIATAVREIEAELVAHDGSTRR
jgi:IclR family pca regulon transcriptional regulator